MSGATYENFALGGDAEGNVWVGKKGSVEKRHQEGNLIFEVLSIDDIAFKNVCAIDVYHEDRSAWIVDGSDDVEYTRVLRLSEDGDKLAQASPESGFMLPYPMQDDPMSVEVDQANGDVWVGTRTVLYKFDKDGNQLFRVPETIDEDYLYFNNPRMLAVDESDGSVWVTNWGNTGPRCCYEAQHEVKKVSADGEILLTLSADSGVGLNGSNTQGVRVDPRNGDVWIGQINPPNHLVKLDRNGGPLLTVSISDYTVVAVFDIDPVSGGLYLFNVDASLWRMSDQGEILLKTTEVEQPYYPQWGGRIENEAMTAYSLVVVPRPQNAPPVANAGDNLAIASEYQHMIVIQGTATDLDNDLLTYRWLKGETELSTWEQVGSNGEASLDLSTVSNLSIGAHTLTLEVSDGQATSTDDMILTVDNSAPNPAPTGGGVYEISTPVTLGGQVSDFDGDVVNYEWLEGENPLFTGQVQTNYGGDPVDLPNHIISALSLGTHTITLRVNDGINEPAESDITVVINDTEAPTLAPAPNKTILWPPNHKMVDITILANASDNGGGPVTLMATVASNEPQDGLGDGDMAPDWTEPVVDPDTGIITLQLRAERSGSGNGREYTVTITATDSSDNSSTVDVKIIVPHDKSH